MRNDLISLANELITVANYPFLVSVAKDLVSKAALFTPIILVDQYFWSRRVALGVSRERA